MLIKNQLKANTNTFSTQVNNGNMQFLTSDIKSVHKLDRDITSRIYFHLKVADYRNAVIVARNPGSAIRYS